MKGLSTVGRTGVEACGDHVRPSLLFGALRAGSLKQEKELRHELQEASGQAPRSVTEYYDIHSQDAMPPALEERVAHLEKQVELLQRDQNLRGELDDRRNGV